MNTHLSRKRAGQLVSLLLAAAFTAAFANEAARAESSGTDHVQRNASVNRALLAVLDGQIAVQQWRLGKLELLQGRGHASWREVAQQQMVVETLQGQRLAAVEFGEFLAALGRRVSQGTDAEDGGPTVPPPNSPPPIKLSLPGSVRLIAWIEPEQLPAHAAADYLGLNISPRGLPTGERAAAKQKVADAERRVRDLKGIAGRQDVAEEVRRAEMELTVAVAELQFTEAFLRWRQAEAERDKLAAGWSHADDDAAPRDEVPNSNPAGAAIPAATAFVAYIHPDTSTALRSATLQVAAAEAAATGELRAAEIVRTRCQLRSEAVQQLHAKGYASARELVEAEATLSAAESLATRLTEQRSRLAQSYRLLAGPSDANRESVAEDHDLPHSGNAAGPTATTPGDDFQVATLPAALLAHPCGVEHLVALRRSRFETQVRRAEVAAKREMLENLLRKLEATGLDGDSFRRELEFLRIDVEYNRAQVLAATQRLRILRLEESRFAHQFDQQLAAAAAGRFGTATDSATVQEQAPTGPTAPSRFQFVALGSVANLGSARWDRLSYFESPAVTGYVTCYGLADSEVALPLIERFDNPYRSSIGRSRYCRRERVYSNLSSLRLSGASYDRPLCDQTLDYGLSRSRDEHPWHDRPRFSFPSYHDYYAFGIRRIDRPSPRGRATSYGGPWYFPGAPTNFR